MKRKKVVEVNLDLSENFQPKQKDYKVDSIKNLGKYKPNSVDNIIFNGVLEQRTGLDRIPVMRAIHRALKPGGRAFATVAHWATAGASMSPYSQWPPLSPESFGFFSKETREASNYKNPEVADIDFDLSWSELYDPGWQSKADNVRAFCLASLLQHCYGLGDVAYEKRSKGEEMKFGKRGVTIEKGTADEFFEDSETPDDWDPEKSDGMAFTPDNPDHVWEEGESEQTNLRHFASGASRDTDEGKPDFSGFLSWEVLGRFGEYMHEHRHMSDGTLRAADDWKKSIPRNVYVQSMFRHFMTFWALHEEIEKDPTGTCYEAEHELEEALCAILFNAQGYLYERLNGR